MVLYSVSISTYLRYLSCSLPCEHELRTKAVQGRLSVIHNVDPLANDFLMPFVFSWKDFPPLSTGHYVSRVQSCSAVPVSNFFLPLESLPERPSQCESSSQKPRRELLEGGYRSISLRLNLSPSAPVVSLVFAHPHSNSLPQSADVNELTTVPSSVALPHPRASITAQASENCPQGPNSHRTDIWEDSKVHHIPLTPGSPSRTFASVAATPARRTKSSTLLHIAALRFKAAFRKPATKKAALLLSLSQSSALPVVFPTPRVAVKKKHKTTRRTVLVRPLLHLTSPVVFFRMGSCKKNTKVLHHSQSYRLGFTAHLRWIF